MDLKEIDQFINECKELQAEHLKKSNLLKDSADKAYHLGISRDREAIITRLKQIFKK